MGYELWFKYNETRSGGGICEGQENDSWPSYEDEYIDFSPVGLYKERPDLVYAHGLLSDEVNGEFERGDDAYLVIVRYGNGNTFSSSNGNWYLVGVYKTADEAHKAQKSVEDGTSKHKYVWTGYFESFESVDTHYMKVL